MDYQFILYRQEGPIGVLTLNRPESLNAVNRAMTEELRHFLYQRLADHDTRVLIITGAGRGFSAGLDMKESMSEVPPGGYSPKVAYEKQSNFSELILLLRRIPQPIIAAVNGAAAGIGFSFALASDIRYASPKAKFSAAYINIGVGGADLGSSWLFPRAVGTANAARYLMTGDLFNAEEALRIGMVQAIFEEDQLLDEAMALANKMASKSPLGLRVTKEAIDSNTSGVTLEQALRLEDRNQALCIAELTRGNG